MIFPVSIPLSSDGSRAQKGFLLSMLSSLRRNSTVKHDVVVVTDDSSVAGIVKNWSARVLMIDGPFVVGRESRLYEWLNTGARAAKTEWILAPTGDDSFFFPGWERLIDEATHDAGAANIWTPGIVETGPGDFRISHDRPADLQITWPEARISEAEILRLVAEHGVDLGVVVERPNDRKVCHWAHTLQRADLFWRAGGFREQPLWPAGHDLALQDKYAELGIEKVCVTGARVGNLKLPVEVAT